MAPETGQEAASRHVDTRRGRPGSTHEPGEVEDGGGTTRYVPDQPQVASADRSHTGDTEFLDVLLFDGVVPDGEEVFHIETRPALVSSVLHSSPAMGIGPHRATTRPSSSPNQYLRGGSSAVRIRFSHEIPAPVVQWFVR